MNWRRVPRRTRLQCPTITVPGFGRLELALAPSMRRRLADRILIQLIEADVETGFALVDEADAYRASGRPEFSSRALQDAEGILADIERRLERLGDSDAGPFH